MIQQRQPTDNQHRWPLVLCLLIAGLVRLTVLWAGFDSLSDDPDSYRRLAVHWQVSGVFGFPTEDGGSRPTAYRPPLYPWLLSWFVSDRQLGNLPVAGLHWMMGMATVWLTHVVARRLVKAWAWLPTLAVACDPLLLRSSQLVMTETLAALLTMLLWFIWLQTNIEGTSPRQSPRNIVRDVFWRDGRCFGLGLALGCCVLTRPTAAPCALVCMAGLAWFSGGTYWQRLRPVVWCGLGVGLFVVPWTLRNQQALGHPVWATTHGGYTLLLANNPPLYEHFRSRGVSRGWNADSFHAAWAARHHRDPAVESPTQASYWQPSAPLPQPGSAKTGINESWDELADDRLAYQAAWATIAREPAMFLKSCLIRAGWFWAWWPHRSGVSAIGIGIWYALWSGPALLGAWTVARRRRWRNWWPAAALIITLTAVHAVYWGNMRMRAPLMGMIYVFACVSCPSSGASAARSDRSDNKLT